MSDMRIIQKVKVVLMLPSVFKKHKISSNRTISLILDNETNIIRKNNEDFAMERRFVIYSSFLQCY